MATTAGEYLRQEGESTLLMNLLEYKFKQVPKSYKQEILGANSQNLLKWSKKVLESETLEGVFND
jgi:hypothetical protein